MRIDLHAHSSVSDGTDTPAVLVAKAKTAGLAVLALTDHDTADGWTEASQAAEVAGLTLVRGIEVSTTYNDRGVHLLAYEPDPDAPALSDILRQGRESRQGRTGAIVGRLQALGAPITVSDVARHSHGVSAGRPHVADALVEAGFVRDRDEAFAKYLHRGGPASVSRWQVDLLDAVAAVAAAGGAPVIAHPWGRGRNLDEADFARLAEAGLAGIEVDHQEHDASARDHLRGIARSLGLIITGSSDHHGTGKVNHDLGCNTTDPEQYEALRERFGGPRTHLG